MNSHAQRRVICALFLGFSLLLSGAARAADALHDGAPRHDRLAAVLPKPQEPAPPARTRFVVGLDRKVEYQVFSLANPNRVVVELPDAHLRLPDASSNKPVGLVKSFRGGLAAPGRARIVIDVTGPVVVEQSKLERDAEGGYRLAIDIMPFSAAKPGSKKPLSVQPAGLGAQNVQPPTPKPAENPRHRAARAFKPVIVLDPGHGGMDTGAKKFGAVEKQVVLAFGHVLRKHLEKTGRYKVLMTRETDVFVELDDRVAYGEKNNANLFIAIHADYARSSARGATIFTLRDGVARDLERSAKGAAARNVMSSDEVEVVRKSSGDVDAVRGILADLAERDVERTRDRTSMFARSVIETMGESTPMRHDPDQQAAFRVLKTAQFPSVLIELAYVTNRQDADNLQSDEWRDRVADSIASAIDNYFSNQVASLPM
jgi:N-acetylmuramoyl-L-alanine amidase